MRSETHPFYIISHYILLYMSYTYRLSKVTSKQMVRPGGFEPPAHGLGNRCSIHLSYGRRIKKSGDPGRIRTCDLLIRSQALYPAGLRSHIRQ